MQVSVLYFGVLKECLRAEQELLLLEEPATVADVVQAISHRTSNLEPALWRSIAVAVNREYASAERFLREGDEVALLPPVSGGCDAR